jgi:DNA-binding NtrC family response regulator
VVAIEMPPLRQRGSDIPLLAMHYLTKFSRENDKHFRGFTDDALSQLARYGWPGNVRELENAIERAVVVGRGDEIGVADLPASIAAATAGAQPGMPPVPGASLAELERAAILKTLEYTGGSTARAAEILGISARKIQYKLHEYAGTKPRGSEATEADADDAAGERPPRR